MRYPDKDSFGKAPDRFTDNLTRALHHEEKTMKKKNIAAIALAVTLTLVIAATALAVAMRAGLLDFFADGESPMDPTGYEHKLGTDGVLLSETYGDLEITVTEGAGALGHYAVVSTVALRDGAAGALSHWSADKPEPAPGKPVYHIECNVIHTNANADVEGGQPNEDGSFSFLSQLFIYESADVGQMYCVLRVAKQEAGQAADDVTTEVVAFPFEMAMEKALDARTMTDAPVAVPGAAVTVDAIYMKKTVSGVFANVYFQYDGGEAVGYIPPERICVWLETDEGSLMDADGGVFTGQWRSGNRYAADIRLDTDTLPDSVTVAFSDWDRPALGSAAVALAKAESLPSDPEAYRRAHPAVDYIDVALPGKTWLQEKMYTSAKEGEAIPMLDVPTDAASVICNIASGMEVVTITEFDDWALVSLGDLFSYRCGYIRKDQLVAEAADAQPGVQRATMENVTEARYAADAQATAIVRFEAGTAVLVLGELGDWAYVAADTGKAGAAQGYVPKESLRMTGERVDAGFATFNIY